MKLIMVKNVEPGQVVKQDPPYKTNYKIKLKIKLLYMLEKLKNLKKLKTD